MAQMKHSSSRSSSNYGEGAVRQASVLASCYVIDASATSLKGFHYCTTTLTGLPSPPSSPPLAAITATNQLSLLPKKRGASGRDGNGNNNTRSNRRGGATLRIREECERFFCETMKAVFQGERSMASNGSGLTGVQHDDRFPASAMAGRRGGGTGGGHGNSSSGIGVGDLHGQMCTPPDDDAMSGFGDCGSHNYLPALGRTVSTDNSSIMSDSASGYSSDMSVGAIGFVGLPASAATYVDVTAWLEVWDYVGGASFRGFLTEDVTGEKALFAFFDIAIMAGDLKQALMALIELADSVLGCNQLIICVDRSAPANEAASLMKGLQWAGFSLKTLDQWTGGLDVDVTSSAWIFMGTEL